MPAMAKGTRSRAGRRQKVEPSDVNSSEQLRNIPPKVPATSTTSSTMDRPRRASSAALSDPNDSVREQKKCRNRTSAVRHRRRKKEMESNLDHKANELIAKNEELKEGIEEMKAVRLQLKNMLMAHSMCGFAPIDQFHLYSAQSVSVGGSMSSAQAASQAANQTIPQDQSSSNSGPDNPPSLSPASPTSNSSQHSPYMATTPGGPSSSIRSAEQRNSIPNGLPQYHNPNMFQAQSKDPLFGTQNSTPTQEHHDPMIKTERVSSSFSCDSGYQTLGDMNNQSLAPSPEGILFDDSHDGIHRGCSSAASDTLWSPIGDSTQTPQTSARTTPHVDSFPTEFSYPFNYEDGSLFDGMCCPPMDTVMDKNQTMRQAIGDDFLSAYFQS